MQDHDLICKYLFNKDYLLNLVLFVITKYSHEHQKAASEAAYGEHMVIY